MRGSETQYEILGISPEASLKEIRQAYRKGALKYHPDNRHPDPKSAEAAKTAEAKFRKLAKAYKAALRAHLPEYEDTPENRSKKAYSPADLARMNTKWYSSRIYDHYANENTACQQMQSTESSRSAPTIDENKVFVMAWAIATILGVATVLSAGSLGMLGNPHDDMELANILAVEIMALLVVAAVLAGAIYGIIRTRETIWFTLQWGVRLLPFLPKAHKHKLLTHNTSYRP